MKNLRTLSVSQVMARTGFPRSAVYRLIYASKLATVRTGVGTTYRVLEASLEEYFAQHVSGTVPSAPTTDQQAVMDAVDRAVLPDGPRCFS